jgi:hypothetical protein
MSIGGLARSDEAGVVGPLRYRFQAIAPDAKRMQQETERCGILGVSRATEVHRFDMHAPERLKSDRTAVRAHHSDCAEGSWACSPAASSAAVVQSSRTSWLFR